MKIYLLSLAVGIEFLNQPLNNHIFNKLLFVFTVWINRCVHNIGN